MPPAFKILQDDLAMVTCGPHRGDPHNVTNVDLATLTASLVGLSRECIRIVSGLGFAHHHDPTVIESELEEILNTGVSRAVCTSATFELNGVPAVRGEEWPPFPEVEAMKTAPRISGCRDLPSLAKASKLAGSLRLRKRRPPPEYCASYPPVASSDLLTKPETLRGSLTFKKLPYLKDEKKPETWRWRYYSLLTGVPYFSPADSNKWGHRPRYFRYATFLKFFLTFNLI